MKIKEVARLTGLSEKTIRRYEESGLVVPEMTEKNGRMFREYSGEDARALSDVAGLRKALFSTEQIRCMQDSPERIPEIVRENREKLRAGYELLNVLIERFDKIDENAIGSVGELAEQLRPAADTLPLPRRDRSPHFGKFDPETEEEKREMYEEFLRNRPKREAEERMHDLGVRLMTWATVAMAAVFLLFVLNQINFGGSVKTELQGIEYSLSDPDYAVERTVTIEGQWYKYLFNFASRSGPFTNIANQSQFRGEMTVSGYPETYNSYTHLTDGNTGLIDHLTFLKNGFYQDSDLHSMGWTGNFKKVVIVVFDSEEGWHSDTIRIIAAPAATREEAVEIVREMAEKYEVHLSDYVEEE